MDKAHVRSYFNPQYTRLPGFVWGRFFYFAITADKQVTDESL